MDKYFKIQKIVELQRERKEKIENIFSEVLGFLPKIEIDFSLQEKMNYKNMSTESETVGFIVKIKIKDKSSIKFAVEKNKQKIADNYRQFFCEDILIF